MPCLPCGARKLSVRARLQMSATDVVRRTEMELKVDQKVLCGEIMRLEDMEQEGMQKNAELLMEVDARPELEGGWRVPDGMCLKDLKVALIADVQLTRKCEMRARQIAEEEKEAEAKFYRLKEERLAMEGAYREQKTRCHVFAVTVRCKEREQGIHRPMPAFKDAGKNPFTDVPKDTANQR